MIEKVGRRSRKARDVGSLVAVICAKGSNSPLMDKMEKAAEKKRGFVKEFMDFLQTFGIIGLAIAFIIGAAASAVVNALVKDLISPIVGIFLPGGSLSSLNATITSPVTQKPVAFLYGDFIAQILYFVIIAIVVFLLYKQLKRVGLHKL